MNKYLLKKIILFFLTFLFFCGTFSPLSYATSPNLTCPSGILVDAKTGQILWEKNAHTKRAIASTTKIMTAVIVLENTKLDEPVITSKQAADVGESELYLAPGEVRTVKELLYGLLLRSANDASVALAEHVGGNVENFVKLMNKKAKEIGALDTYFTNPHGLSDKGHYSTAYDLSIIARYALNNPEFRMLVSTKEYKLPWPGNKYERVLKNHNELLWVYPYATGIKTGYTKEAGYCLVASAKKGKSSLIAVVLGEPTSKLRFDEAVKLLNYGFLSFEPRKLVTKGKIYTEITFREWGRKKFKLVAKDNLRVQTRKGAQIKYVIKLKKGYKLPIKRNKALGWVVVLQNGYELGRIELVPLKDIPKPNLFQRIMIFFENLFG